jgi:hypothetical protein
MKIITCMYLFLSALILAFLIPCDPNASTALTAIETPPGLSIDNKLASQFVVVDQSEPAFIVFTGIPKNIGKKKLEEVILTVSKEEKLSMLTWEQFLGSVNEYARSVVVRNDYPNAKVVDGLVCLVASEYGSGSPWGLTWNSGVALTYNDYEHARRTYELYRTNAASYKTIWDPIKDPTNPGGHLPFGGCD